MYFNSPCAFCGKKLGIFTAANQAQFSDGSYLCGKCLKKYGVYNGNYVEKPFIAYAKEHTPEDFKNLLDSGKTFADIRAQYMTDNEKQALAEQVKQRKLDAKYESLLKEAKSDDATLYDHFYFDSKKKFVLEKKGLFHSARFIKYSDIISYRPNEKGHGKLVKHGITRAIVGGALAGSVGAIIGATTGGKSQEYVDHLGVIVNLKDGSNFEVVISSTSIKSNSLSAKLFFKVQDQLISTLESIVSENQSNASASNNAKSDDPTVEIRKYKKLADDGIITDEEFEKKKKQLLNL